MTSTSFCTIVLLVKCSCFWLLRSVALSAAGMRVPRENIFWLICSLLWKECIKVCYPSIFLALHLFCQEFIHQQVFLFMGEHKPKRADEWEDPYTHSSSRRSLRVLASTCNIKSYTKVHIQPLWQNKYSALIYSYMRCSARRWFTRDKKRQITNTQTTYNTK